MEKVLYVLICRLFYRQKESKTGFFTSPHLIKINERIQIDREEISDDTFYDVFCEAYHVAQEMEQEGEGHPSYFEFLFGMGMKAFEKAGVEYIILETGLGGRLDATNAVGKSGSYSYHIHQSGSHSDSG